MKQSSKCKRIKVAMNLLATMASDMHARSEIVSSRGFGGSPVGDVRKQPHPDDSNCESNTDSEGIVSSLSTPSKTIAAKANKNDKPIASSESDGLTERGAKRMVQSIEYSNMVPHRGKKRKAIQTGVMGDSTTVSIHADSDSDAERRKDLPVGFCLKKISADNMGGGVLPWKPVDEDSDLDLHSGLATLEGQLQLNPNMSEDEARAAAKKEYNRRNAARARIRSKGRVQDLQKRVEELTRRTSQLQKTNEVLQAKVDVLTKQNNEVEKDCKRKPARKAAQAVSQSSASVNDLLAALLGSNRGAVVRMPPPAPIMIQQRNQDSLGQSHQLSCSNNTILQPPTGGVQVHQMSNLIAQLQILLAQNCAQPSSAPPQANTTNSFHPPASAPAPPSILSQSHQHPYLAQLLNTLQAQGGLNNVLRALTPVPKTDSSKGSVVGNGARNDPAPSHENDSSQLLARFFHG